jgi:hypothetical protein
MKCVRPVLVGFVVVTCFFLMGFKKPVHKSPSRKHQQVEEAKGQQKPLDLTIPISEVSFQKPPEALTIAEGASPGTLIADSIGKVRPVEFQGNVIMTSEPEAGKSKSADGAGIMINLHH